MYLSSFGFIFVKFVTLRFSLDIAGSECVTVESVSLTFPHGVTCDSFHRDYVHYVSEFTTSHYAVWIVSHRK